MTSVGAVRLSFPPPSKALSSDPGISRIRSLLGVAKADPEILIAEMKKSPAETVLDAVNIITLHTRAIAARYGLNGYPHTKSTVTEQDVLNAIHDLSPEAIESMKRELLFLQRYSNFEGVRLAAGFCMD